MAGYSEKDIDTEEEQWKPPTEAEMKIIQARRERSDRISKIMGSYLLKGYKMLATECLKCGTIQLQDKQGVLYCVACEEIDPDIQKDNPALSEEAASSQRAEFEFSSEFDRPEEENEPTDAEYNNACATFAARLSTLMSENSGSGLLRPSRQIHNAPSPPIQPQLKRIQPNNNITNPSAYTVEEECTKCVQTILRKMSWARQALESETNPDSVMSYLRVITSCAEAAGVLKKASANKSHHY